MLLLGSVYDRESSSVTVIALVLLSFCLNLKMFLQVLVHGDFMGLDLDTNSVHSAAPVVVAPHPRETQTYYYKTGVYGECSATCNGGMQYRSVECWVQDPVNPHKVDETYCITQRLQRPQSQQACNMHPCAAEYSVSSFSVVCSNDEELNKSVSRASGNKVILV